MKKPDELIGKKLSVEALIGRGFYHYTGGEKDEPQPLALKLSDFKLKGKDEKANINTDKEEVLFNYYLRYFGDSFWMRRYAMTAEESRREAYIIIGLKLDEDMLVTDCRSIVQYISRLGGVGGCYFMSPGDYMSGSSVFKGNSKFPERVLQDLEQLQKLRYLPDGFSLRARPFPQALIEAEGSGGSLKEYTFGYQSAYRPANTYLSVKTDEGGLIEQAYYSSFQTYGNTGSEMTRRPVSTYDRGDEAVDMLLHVLDQYSDAEFGEMVKG